MTRILVILAALTSLALIVGAFFVPSITLSIPQAQIQQVLDRALPIGVEKFGVDGRLDTAQVRFLEDGRVGITAAGTASGYGMAGDIALDCASALRYADGAFTLQDLALEDFDLTLDEQSKATAQDRITIMTSLRERASKAIGAGNASVQEAVRNEISRAAEGLREEALARLNATLATTPVYRLSQGPAAAKLAAMAITDVQVQPEALTVTLSPARFMGNLLFMAAIGLMALIASLGVVMGLLRR